MPAKALKAKAVLAFVTVYLYSVSSFIYLLLKFFKTGNSPSGVKPDSSILNLNPLSLDKLNGCLAFLNVLA